jgi:protein-L-isoaspartate(D-aspartate) O-methyltransferase
MVEEQLHGRGIHNPRVLRIMAAVPRHLFVDPAFMNRAYSDHALPIGQEQTISQPYMVALMTQELGIEEDEELLV